MGRAAHTPADLPPVTDDHRRAAFVSLRWMGTYEMAMSAPFRAQLIEARAHVLRTQEWERTTKRTVVPVPRVVLGSDGHPLRYVTQLVPGPRQTTPQNDLFS